LIVADPNGWDNGKGELQEIYCDALILAMNFVM